MSPRKTARPHKDAAARPGKSVRSSLIAKDKAKMRSAQASSALDNRFHRTARGSPARTARGDRGPWRTVKQRFGSGATAS